MKRFDPNHWQEIDLAEWQDAPRGRVHVKCSDPYAAVYLERGGVDALVGVGPCVSASGNFDRVKVEAKKGSRAFLFNPFPNILKNDTEPTLTNPDKALPGAESGTTREVRRALLELRAERMAWLRAASRSPQNDVTEPAPEPDPEPEPEPVAEPDPTTDDK